MIRHRPDLVIIGDVVIAARRDGLARAEAIGLAAGRVVAVGRREDVLAARAAGARVVDAGPAAVIPGLHDFHVHLVGAARARAEVALDDAVDATEIGQRLRRRAAALPGDAWILGRGWSERQLSSGLESLIAAVGDRPAFLTSHDGHSAWASPNAISSAGIGAEMADPPGGRIERDAEGGPTGILRETALDLVDRIVPRLRGSALVPHLEGVVAEMLAFGITGATEAGDYTDEGGVGPEAALGDSYSTLAGVAESLDGRLRLTLGIPVDAMPVAVERGLRTGARLAGRRTLRFGWAKEYADGALGSGTAALFEPATCGDGTTGILRVDAADLDALLEASRRSGIALAIHAIGDRAAATVLDAMDRNAVRTAGSVAHRMEHLQLIRAEDRRRLAALGVTASVQPIHAAIDRDLVHACWRDRLADAYPYRSIAQEGAVLAAGSDAPIESFDPWHGIFAALHRRLPADEREDWTPEESLTFTQSLAAYSLGPARAIGAADQGHLRIGAVADLAVLDRTVEELDAGGERLASTRSVLTLIDGAVVHER